MKIVLISDTHSLHPKMRHKIPQGNVLIHGGDCTNIGKENEVKEFIDWFKNIDGFDIKILIAGNHDFGFEKKEQWFLDLIDSEKLKEHNCVYLEDSEYIIKIDEFPKEVKVYGSPWQPWFYNWAFNLPRNGEELEKKWKNIPNDTDILVTHGPPFGILDYPPTNVNVGCEILRFHVEQIKPKIHVMGHIHHSRGLKEVDGTLFINASVCDERYRPINKPIVVDLNINDDNEIIVDVIDF